MRNILSGRDRVALVIDDMVSFDPLVARAIRVYERAAEPVERVGLAGPGIYSRIVPTVSWSWNMEGEPLGDTWYEARRAHHSPADT